MAQALLRPLPPGKGRAASPALPSHNARPCLLQYLTGQKLHESLQKQINLRFASSLLQGGFAGEVCSPLSPLAKAETSDIFLKMLLVTKSLLLLSKIYWCAKQNLFSWCQKVYLYFHHCHASRHTASHFCSFSQTLLRYLLP